MGTRIDLVISRSDDRVVVMVPGDRDDARMHAIVTEEEAYCASNAVRRMIPSRERRSLVLGTAESGMRIERVDHPGQPLEVHLEDNEGVTVIDMTRDDALGFADMLWAAHRATGQFYAMVSISGGMRRNEHQDHGVLPRADALDLGDARIMGALNRRVRGEGPEAKI